MVKIVQKESKVLRNVAKEVPLKNIGSAAVKKILSDMKKALASQKDGVAIAAPQINKSLRIFVVVEDMFNINKEKEENDKLRTSYKTFINPVIAKLSKKQDELEEGCLSVRWKYGKVKRSSKATVQAYDENGKSFTYSASGLLAQIFQHETDHLDGILFTDKAVDIRNIKPDSAHNALRNEAGGEKN